jgi:hypothetical protein
VEAGTRRTIAYVAGRAISGRQSSSVYDYDASGHFNFTGTVSADRANVYDFARGCHVSGTLTSLYDYGTGASVQLHVNGQRFSGYDYSSGSHFSGRVAGQSVSLYDYETGSPYSYSV